MTARGQHPHRPIRNRPARQECASLVVHDPLLSKAYGLGPGCDAALEEECFRNDHRTPRQVRRRQWPCRRSAVECCRQQRRWDAAWRRLGAPQLRHRTKSLTRARWVALAIGKSVTHGDDRRRHRPKGPTGSPKSRRVSRSQLGLSPTAVVASHGPGQHGGQDRHHDRAGEHTDPQVPAIQNMRHADSGHAPNTANPRIQPHTKCEHHRCGVLRICMPAFSARSP